MEEEVMVKKYPRHPLAGRFSAFVRGIREFRSDWTSHYDWPLIEWYDAGREFAHRATGRRYDGTAG